MITSHLTVSRDARRLVLAGTLAAALTASGCAASSNALAEPSYTLSAAQIQKAIAQKFPRNYGMGGLVNLELDSPRIGLKPQTNQLNAVLALVASGPLMKQRSYNGELDVDFSLRYEPSDRTLRATQLQFNGLRMEGMNASAQQMLQQYGSQIAQRALQEVVLYQLSTKDLAFADGLGVEPGSFTVTPRGLVVQLQRKSGL